ncbi:hypothetical protein EV645_4843 [Kribbella rubisoli]|uniref:Uncharacterized protein n=1 Tax=Kribbella rubisoli TaxID=3075929 RepID=A0A4Q7WVD5_9ACTN|nr:hypothetical protein EV649_7829 [Kribbella sp. VKM Ac-2569]RZU13983.1 hypothetical protein EV645_4843 [Kribbella rubisoli]
MTNEVLRVAHWIAPAVLGQKDTICAIGPPWASATHISRPKALG